MTEWKLDAGFAPALIPIQAVGLILHVIIATVKILMARIIAVQIMFTGILMITLAQARLAIQQQRLSWFRQAALPAMESAKAVRVCNVFAQEHLKVAGHFQAAQFAAQISNVKVKAVYGI